MSNFKLRFLLCRKNEDFKVLSVSYSTYYFIIRVFGLFVSNHLIFKNYKFEEVERNMTEYKNNNTFSFEITKKIPGKLGRAGIIHLHHMEILKHLHLCVLEHMGKFVLFLWRN